AKVEAYRTRFINWFTSATDGRGTMDARLNGNGCTANPPPPPPMDAGTPPPSDDAGTPPPPEEDAGTVAQDAGVTMPPIDETPTTPMMTAPHVPTKDETHVNLGTGYVRPGCG